ncbi:MAG: hypothetical protein KJN93_00415 [Alphaproteobacteria bacterium]|nr:hypothetical protein [Alphaproteobacteria bacterium]NNF23923.1 hypothetical protein [Paracoccaceae bacterium]
MIGRLWRRNKVLLIAFVAVAALAVFFTFRTVMMAVYWADQRHLDQPIAGWMTPRYVSRAWDLPPDLVAGALLLDRAEKPGRQTLAEIARDRGVAPEDLIAALETAIRKHRAGE